MTKNIADNGAADARAELEPRLRGELDIKYSYLARANTALMELTGTTLEQTVEGYPRVVNFYYRASNEAAGYMGPLSTRMARIERRHRKAIAAETVDGSTKPRYANEAARADELADRLDADAEYQVLLDLYAECATVKADAALDGDQLRRELYNMRERHFQEMRRATIELEHERRMAAAVRQ